MGPARVGLPGSARVGDLMMPCRRAQPSSTARGTTPGGLGIGIEDDHYFLIVQNARNREQAPLVGRDGERATVARDRPEVLSAVGLDE